MTSVRIRKAVAIVCGCLLLTVGLWASGAQAQQQNPSPLPLWEIGFGLGVRSTADYPGSRSYSERLVAYPYVAYRGRFLQINDLETFRFVPFQTDRLELAISIDSATGADRRENPIRGDLPDLDPLAEFGPEVIWRLKDTAPIFGDQAGGRLEFALQTRGVFSIGKSIGYEGFLVRPALRYRQNGALKPGSRIEATLGPVFTTQGVQDYFYSVDATDTQTGYEASAGYLGTEFTASLRYPVGKRTRLIGGITASYLGGAASHDSPLLETDYNATVFVGFTYSLFQSKRFGVRDR